MGGIQFGNSESWLLVGDDTKIQPAIVVEVGDRKPASVFEKVDTGSQAGVFECSLAVEEQSIAFVSTKRKSFDFVGVRIDLENGKRVVESIPGRMFAKFFWLLWVEPRDRAPIARSQIAVAADILRSRVKPAWHIEVQPAVVVEVCELAAESPSNFGYVFGRCDLSEFSSVVAKQKISFRRFNGTLVGRSELLQDSVAGFGVHFRNMEIHVTIVVVVAP